MPALTLAAGPVISDDISIVPILANLATAIAHGFVAAFTFIATHSTQVAVAFLAALAVLAAVPIVVALVISVHDWCFGTNDDDSRSYPRPSPRHRETTRLLHQPPTPPSYTRNSYTRSQSQTVGQAPAIPDYYRSYYSSSHVLSHGGESRPTPQTTVRTQASYQPPSTYGHVSQHTVRTSATTGNERNLYRSGSSLTSPDAGQSRQAPPASARTQTSHQPPLASARTQTSHQPAPTSSRSQTTVRNPSTTDYDRSLYGPSRALPPAGESRQATSTSAHAQASYQRSPSPEPAHIFILYQSTLTHPSTLSSPSAYPQESTAAGRSTLTQVVQPSPVPAALSDEVENVENVNTATDLRERARRQHREMCNARARAKSAHKTGDSVAERMHKQEVIAHRSAMDQLNTRAAEMIFKQKNKGHKEGTADFHGLFVPEAIRYAKQELESASRRGDVVVRFIVGKGLHTEDGEAKIRPALEKLCNERGLTHSLDPRNAGVLIVQLG